MACDAWEFPTRLTLLTSHESKMPFHVSFFFSVYYFSFPQLFKKKSRWNFSLDKVEKPEDVRTFRRRSRGRVRGLDGQRHPQENVRRLASTGSLVNETWMANKSKEIKRILPFHPFKFWIQVFLFLTFFCLYFRVSSSPWNERYRKLVGIWIIIYLFFNTDKFCIKECRWTTGWQNRCLHWQIAWVNHYFRYILCGLLKKLIFLVDITP